MFTKEETPIAIVENRHRFKSWPNVRTFCEELYESHADILAEFSISTLDMIDRVVDALARNRDIFGMTLLVPIPSVKEIKPNLRSNEPDILYLIDVALNLISVHPKTIQIADAVGCRAGTVRQAYANQTPFLSGRFFVVDNHDDAQALLEAYKDGQYYTKPLYLGRWFIYTKPSGNVKAVASGHGSSDFARTLMGPDYETDMSEVSITSTISRKRFLYNCNRRVQFSAKYKGKQIYVRFHYTTVKPKDGV